MHGAAARGRRAPRSTSGRRRPRLRRNGWTIALYVLAGHAGLLPARIRPATVRTDVQVTCASACIAGRIRRRRSDGRGIAGGIDLSIGSVMALTSVIAAVLMKGRAEEFAVVVVILVLWSVADGGASNGALVVLTRVPDIIVTLAMPSSGRVPRCLVLSGPGGWAARWFRDFIGVRSSASGSPRRCCSCSSCPSVWCGYPSVDHDSACRYTRWERPPWPPFEAASTSSRTKIAAYAITGLFARAGGLALTMSHRHRLPGAR